MIVLTCAMATGQIGRGIKTHDYNIESVCGINRRCDLAFHCN